MNIFRNKKIIFAASGFITLLFFWYAFGSETEEERNIYASPERGTFNVNITTTGELRAKSSTSISGPTGMREFRIYRVQIQRLVPEGTVVAKGDFVAELDRSEITTTLKDARIELKEEQKEYETAKLDSSLSLSKVRNNIVDLEFALEEAEIAVEQSKYESPAQQRQVKNDYRQAKRSLDQARKEYETQKQKSESRIQSLETELTQQRREVEKIESTLKQFMIRAPEKGMVIYRRNRDGSKISEGDQINVFNPVVAKLPDFSVMNSITYVNEVDIQKVSSGQKVEIGLDAMPEKELTGRVTKIANIGEQRPNSDSKVFQVAIEINESDSTLRPSMTTSNTIHVSAVDSALYVPLETIHTSDSTSYVFKTDGMNLVKQQVILGMMNDEDVIIKEGVSMDDQLYLSTPSDTTNITNKPLPQDILEKYEDKKEPDTEGQAEKKKLET